jgi:multidrug efflux pump subunit AcrB
MNMESHTIEPAGRPDAEQTPRGPIAWMVRNRVTPNLVMLFFLLGGLMMTAKIKKEVFPEFALDVVSVRVAYPGASPEEVEQGIILAIEEAVRGIEGVKEVTAVAAEGSGRVRVELLAGADHQKALQDIKQEIDRITTFPEEAEQPQVMLETRRRQVVNLQLYGHASEWALRNLAEEVRDRLLQYPDITQVELVGARHFEVHIEVPPQNLRAYGLTLAQIAQKIRATSVELPGGSVRTEGGEILVRFRERRDWAEEFARLPVVSTPAGSVLYLGDIAAVREGFEDTDRVATYNGLPAVGLEVYRVGEQTPIGVSRAVRAAMAEIETDLPPGIHYDISRDWSEIYQQRLQLLMKNGFIGLILVLLVLGVFLELKLALWVTMAIPVSFLGAILLLPGWGMTINMMSMFAFIVALGMVVDNAIVAGENVYEYRQRGLDRVSAAIRGVRDMAVPIAFSVLTNIVAFIPLYFVPGTIGKVWQVIPVVVILAFLISWIQAMWILPSHLAHTRSKPRTDLGERLHHRQQAVSRWLARFIRNVYGPFLQSCIRWRYLTLSVGLAIFMIMAGYVHSGRIGMILMPRVEADQAVATAVLPVGSPVSRAIEVRDQLEQAAREITAQNGGPRLVRGLFSLISDNEVEVFVHLTAADVRPLNTFAVTRLWRERVGALPGLESLRFAADRGGPGSGAALSIELSHRDVEVLDRASRALARQLEEFPYVKDVNDGRSPGKEQLDFRLKPEGRSLGLTSQEVARQVRAAFHGAEALRQQRGRNEIKVMVRMPAAQRVSEYDVEQLLIRTPGGRDVPLRQIAEVERGRAYMTINRRDGRRTITVTADVEPLGRTGQVISGLNTAVLPQLARDHPGLTYGYQGRQADLRDSVRSLLGGFVLALAAIYFLLAVPFRSYVQPVIVMVSIPFGIVGAVLGHMIMGYDLSVMSLMGLVALAGVVVNGSLVLIVYANALRADGAGAHDAICAAGLRRFRPIILTTLTTFGGLAPMIFETSRQARFMIPMALSLGYGILFAALVSLLLVPCFYLVIEDIRALLRAGHQVSQDGRPPAAAAPVRPASQPAR